MTEKQKRFCDEYLVDTNATQAAIRAGYSKKTAKQIGQENLTKPDLKKYIEEQLESIHEDTIATAKEVMQYLTSVMRGETESEIVVVEGDGDGCSSASTMTKAPDEKEKLKAAELLGKRWGLFKDNVNIDGSVPITFVDDLGDDE